ncbi:MAG: hypothetical protein JSR85_06435 [Proteobacteria bacterium]|nr:hypothetical protein [Pseudomonadota bacterium]
MLKKYSMLMIMLCSCFTSAHAMSGGKAGDEDEGGYRRPGTIYVVKARPGSASPRVQQLLEDRKDVLAPTASLATLDGYFSGEPCSVEGPIQEIFNLFNSPRADLTVTQRALALLPEDHVLSVHVYEPVVTEESEPAITVQHANSRDGTPTEFTGVLKYQTEEEDFRVDINVVFDLTGAKKPKLSVVKKTRILAAQEGSPSAMGDDFTRERATLAAGVKHVAIYAPGALIPITRGGQATKTRSIRQKFSLGEEESGSGSDSDE